MTEVARKASFNKAARLIDAEYDFLRRKLEEFGSDENVFTKFGVDVKEDFHTLHHALEELGGKKGNAEDAARLFARIRRFLGLTEGEVAVLSELNGIEIARESDVMHLVRQGILIFNYLDNEATDKSPYSAAITNASLTVTDFSFNPIAAHIFEPFVPDRVGLSPEAFEVTRYLAETVRDPKRPSPQTVAAQILDTVQKAPMRLWDLLGEYKKVLGDAAYEKYFGEDEVDVAADDHLPKKTRVRYIPLFDKKGNVVKKIRLHEPPPDGGEEKMSYLCSVGEHETYSDKIGRWKVMPVGKLNLGFRNIPYDNRLDAVELYRANFPLKHIYALNKKGMHNHAVDLFTAFLHHYFFSTNVSEKLVPGHRRDAETGRERISAKQELIFEVNTHVANPDVGLSEGLRLDDGTLLNKNRGHNDPAYDNSKSIGEHRELRRIDPKSLAEVEMSGNIDRFRDFLTRDEDGTNPIRFAVVSANDDKIYRAVPLIMLGSDDLKSKKKNNSVWAMRADIDYMTHVVEAGGKTILEMSADEIAGVIGSQRGQPGRIFYEIQIKKPVPVTDLDSGLRAGHCPDLRKDVMRTRRDLVVDYIDNRDQAFLDKVADGFAKANAYTPPADDLPRPYADEEIWTARGKVDYPYIELDGKKVFIPRVVRAMAMEEFERINYKMGDTVRELLHKQAVEWDPSPENVAAYVRKRDDVEKKLERYQSVLPPEEPRIVLPQPFYNRGVFNSRTLKFIDPDLAKATVLQDRLYLMDKVPESTMAYDVQQKIGHGAEARWQTIPFETLARMPEPSLLALKDDGRLRVTFEENPTRPAYCFAIRHFMENGEGALLTPAQRQFYYDETADLVNGPAGIDPDKHRIMTAPKQLRSIDRQLRNIKPGSKEVAASRLNEKGVYELFVPEDLGDAFLNSVAQDAIRRLSEHQQTPKSKFAFGIDPVTDQPLLAPRYEVSEDALVVKMPDGFSKHPASHPAFGHKCFILPRLPGLTKATDIVLEEERTGCRFYVAEPVIQKMPPRRQGGFDLFFNAADRPYDLDGREPPVDGFVVSGAEISPIFRSDPRGVPAVSVEQPRLVATRAPLLANFGREEKLTGFVCRKYDLDLKKNQQVRLRGRDKDGEDTGWEAQVKITGTKEIALPDLLDKMADPAQHAEVDRLAWLTGHANADDLKAFLLSEFTRFGEDIRDQKNTLLFFEISTPERLDYWMPKQPRAEWERKFPANANEASPASRPANRL